MTINITTPRTNIIKIRDPYQKPKGRVYYSVRNIIQSTVTDVKINLCKKFKFEDM